MKHTNVLVFVEIEVPVTLLGLRAVETCLTRGNVISSIGGNAKLVLDVPVFTLPLAASQPTHDGVSVRTVFPKDEKANWSKQWVSMMFGLINDFEIEVKWTRCEAYLTPSEALHSCTSIGTHHEPISPCAMHKQGTTVERKGPNWCSHQACSCSFTACAYI